MADDPLPRIIKGALGLLGILAALTLLGLQVSPQLAAIAVMLAVGLAILTDRGGQVDIAFWMIAIPLTLLLIELLVPDFITSRLPRLDLLLGLDLSGLDLVAWLVLSALAVLVVWVVDIRFLKGTAKKPETVAKRLRTRIQRLVETYITTTRLLFVLVFGVAIAVLSEAGQGLGELGQIAADVPFVAASFVTGLIGFGALGGQVPLIGGLPVVNQLTAGEFLLLTIVVIGLAAAVRFQ